MSFFTCFCVLPQKEHLSRSPPSPIRATYDLPALTAELLSGSSCASPRDHRRPAGLGHCLDGTWWWAHIRPPARGCLCPPPCPLEPIGSPHPPVRRAAVRSASLR